MYTDVVIQRLNASGAMRSFRCAICEREVTYTDRWPATYPFCSERCRLVDLGRWLREDYVIDRDLTPEDLADQDISRQLPPDE